MFFFGWHCIIEDVFRTETDRCFVWGKIKAHITLRRIETENLATPQLRNTSLSPAECPLPGPPSSNQFFCSAATRDIFLNWYDLASILKILWVAFFLIRKFKFSSVILSPFPSLKNLFSLVSLIKKKKKQTICNSMEWGRGGTTQFFSFAQIILSILQSSFHSPRSSWSARPLNKYISIFHAWNACAHQSGPAAWVWDTHSHSGPQAQKGQCLA